MMITIVALLISMITGVLAYFSSGNFILAIGVALTYIGYFWLFVNKKLKKSALTRQSAHECNNFINTFLLSMSIRNSMNEAYENATINATNSFRQEILHLEQLAIRQRIESLNKYFCFDIYHMFLNVLSLYEEQGGNILLMSEALIKEANRLEQMMITLSSLTIRKVFEFTVLWMITMAIVVFMRFGLAQFYAQMLNGLLLAVMTILLFSLFLFSIHMAITRLTDTSIIGDNHHASL